MTDFEFKVYRWSCPATGMARDLEDTLNSHKENRRTRRTLLQIIPLPEHRGDCLLVYRQDIKER